MPDMTVSKNQEHCMVCRTPLRYLLAAEDLTCSVCGTAWRGHVKCPNGHVLCDACHGSEVRKIIEGMALTDGSRDPGEIAERMMAHPSLPMLGCEHAFVAAGALLAAIRNSPYGKISEQEVREVFDRTEKQAHGGYCGLTGVCGIAPAVGAVLSVFLGARCGSDREQRIVMEAVTRVSRDITDLTGPSCCKAYVRAALGVAVPFLAEQFGMVLPFSALPAVCGHAERHPHGCREEKCPFYRKPAKEPFADVQFVPGTVSCAA
jgi:LSD1 subclass zinc finger protein